MNTHVIGTDLKTVNNVSILGGGNIVLPVSSLTTTGNGGVAGLSSGVLNIPQYATNGDQFPTHQTVSSGTTITITNQTTDQVWLLVDLPSTAATFAITLPAVGQNGQTIAISFGGTITSGPVVTTLSILPNSGQAILESTTPVTAAAGDTITYRWKSAISKWYRIS